MLLLNPKNPDYNDMDEKSKNLLKKTIEFFETKGLKKLKHDDHERVWYQDFADFIKKEKIFATLMTPKGYGASDSRWDSYRNCMFSEITGFYGLAYWYIWQVSMLGLGPIWISKNEKIKNKAAKLLEDGGIFAFGLSEKEHGADLISSDMMVYPKGDGRYTANGDKYYIGNANKAALVSTFGKVEGSGDFMFFAVESTHKNYECIQNVTNSQNYVGEYALHNYPLTEDDVLSRGRDAWDASLATIAFCKYNLGWASIGMSTHAFYEAMNHAANRNIFNQHVTDFPHIQKLFVEAYSRLVSMRLFTLRSSDYMRNASADDRRYLLFNPMVKVKVTMQGEEVINCIWDVVAAKGFEKNMFFEMAARDIRALPKLEGTAHINMMLVTNFIQTYLFEPKAYPDLPRRNDSADDNFLFNQGSTTKGLKKIQFHDYKIAYNSVDSPNLKVFKEQIEAFKHFLTDSPLDKAQTRDIDFMLSLGEAFCLIPYGQLIIENSKYEKVDADLLDQIFEYLVKDFSKYILQIYSKSSATPKQMENCLKVIRKPATEDARFERIWKNHVYALNGKYEMNP